MGAVGRGWAGGEGESGTAGRGVEVGRPGSCSSRGPKGKGSGPAGLSKKGGKEIRFSHFGFKRVFGKYLKINLEKNSRRGLVRKFEKGLRKIQMDLGGIQGGV